MGLLSVSFWVRVFHFAFVRFTLKSTFNQQFHLFRFGFGGFFNMRLVILLFHLTCAWSKIKSKHFKLSNLYHCMVDCSSFALKFIGNLFENFSIWHTLKTCAKYLPEYHNVDFFFMYIQFIINWNINHWRKKNYWKIEIQCGKLCRYLYNKFNSWTIGFFISFFIECNWFCRYVAIFTPLHTIQIDISTRTTHIGYSTSNHQQIFLKVRLLIFNISNLLFG